MYTINIRTDNEVGGVFPQVSCETLDFAHQIKAHIFINLDSPILFTLEPEAKITDILSQASISSYGLMINDKVKNCLSNYKIIHNHTYACTVIDGKHKLQYYWFQIYDSKILNTINYKESKFYLTEFGFRESNVTLTSFEDFEQHKIRLGKMWGFGADFIKFTNAFDYSLDMFYIPYFGKSIYISDKLAATLIDNKITGMELEHCTSIE